MFAMKALHDEFEAWVAKGHELFAKILGEAPKVEAEAKADAEQVKRDAAPVVAEAEHDAVKVAEGAVKTVAEDVATEVKAP